MDDKSTGISWPLTPVLADGACAPGEQSADASHRPRATPNLPHQFFTYVNLGASMRWRAAILVFVLGLGAISLLHAQKPFRQYDSWENRNFPLPPDWQTPADF